MTNHIQAIEGLAGVNIPTQARSLVTFTRILDAAETLMDQKFWVDVTIAEIITSAPCSVGSFYARFKDKSAVLECLSARLSEDASSVAALTLGAPASGSLEQHLGNIVDSLLDFHRQRIGLVRTLTLLPRIQSAQRLPEDGLKTAAIFHAVIKSIVQLGIPQTKVSMGLFLTVNAIREHLLFPDISAHLIDISDSDFRDELVNAFAAYLKS